jgi:glycosyltransferase involved in cell wall biosynthesis
VKVLHVIDRLDIGGAEKVFLTITSLLKEKRIDVQVLLFNAEGALFQHIDQRISKHILNRRNKYSMATLQRANKICCRFDIVHVHMRHCYGYIHLARLLFRGRYKLILHDHFGNIQVDKSVPLKLKLLTPEFYIGVSQSLYSWAISQLKTDAEKTFLLRNTVQVQNGPKNESNKSESSWLMISNFRQVKNIEFAVSLFKKLNYKLDIYGQIVDEEYYRKIQHLVGDSNNIRLITNTSSVDLLEGNYDFAIHTSQSESGPLVLMEYLAHGIPFVAYETGEVATIVKEELPTLFMQSFVEHDWFERIQEIQKQKDIGTKLKRVFNEKFSTENYIQNCLSIYNTVLSS